MIQTLFKKVYNITRLQYNKIFAGKNMVTREFYLTKKITLSEAQWALIDKLREDIKRFPFIEGIYISEKFPVSTITNKLNLYILVNQYIKDETYIDFLSDYDNDLCLLDEITLSEDVSQFIPLYSNEQEV